MKKNFINRLNIKSFFALFFLLFFNYLSPDSFFNFSQKTEITKSSVYIFLKEIKNFLEEKEFQQGADYKNIVKSMELIKSVDNYFEQGLLSYNPEISYQFYSILDFFRNKEKIRIVDLRKLKEKIKNFQSYLYKYENKRKYFLKESDIKIISELKELVCLFSLIFGDDRFLNTKFSDYLLDFFWYRPVGFIHDNKSVILPTIIVAGSLVSIYFIYKFFEKNKKNGSGLEDADFKDLDILMDQIQASANKKFLIKQIRVTSQKGLECGQNSLKNILLALAGAQDKVCDKEISEKILDIINLEVAKLKTLPAYQDDKNYGVGYLRSDQLEALIDPVLEELKKVNVGVDFGKVCKEDILVVRLDELGTKESGLSEKIYFSGYGHKLLKNIERFKDKKNIGLVVGSGAHWIGQTIAPTGADGNFQGLIFDSLNIERSKSTNVLLLLNLYSNSVLPSSEMVENVGDKLASCQTLLESEAKLDQEDFLPRSMRIWPILNEIIRYALIRDYFQNNNFGLYKEKIKDIFEKILPELKKIEVHDMIIDMDLLISSENFEQYLSKLKDRI